MENEDEEEEGRQEERQEEGQRQRHGQRQRQRPGQGHGHGQGRRLREEVLHPHAYHGNLPPNHIDPTDGIPFISKFAQKKAQQVLKLAHSIQLRESLFVADATEEEMETNEKDGDEIMMGMDDHDHDDHHHDDDDEAGAGLDMDEVEDDDDDDDEHAFPKDYNLVSVMKKCTRLQAQLSTLESLKHSGVTQLELCRLVLHILNLVTATVSVEYVEYKESHQSPPMSASASEEKSDTSSFCSKRATLHFENVGYIFNEAGKGGEDRCCEPVKDKAEWDRDLARSFALPSPAREALLSIAISIMSKKSLLRSVSNAAIYPTHPAAPAAPTNHADQEHDKRQENRFMMILHWQAFFRLLIRTAPYLDDDKVANPPVDSNSRQTAVLRRTVHLIRNARHFFDQGVRPPGTTTSVRPDASARDIWGMVEDDILHRHFSHAAYRGLIVMYLFQPTRCTSEFYLNLLPKWLDGWSSVDRCHEMDFVWLVLFCRARKHVSPEKYDWGPLRRRLLTHCQYWLQIPLGGVSMDQTFPTAGNPRSRSCPSRLKSFVGSGSSYGEGIDFLAKVGKLLVLNIGVAPPSDGNGNNISDGTSDVLRLLSFTTPYFNPSNVGNWTFTLGAFLHYFSYEICHRFGCAASVAALKSTRPHVANALLEAESYLNHIEMPPKELVLLLDALLPLCQQALYSKNGHVGRAGEAAIVYLSQVDHRITAPFLDFAATALGVSAVNLSHQAPAALSAMTRLVQPALRRQPAILLSRLPQLLALSLAGIDSNDQNKCIRTLIFYRNLASWIPIGFPNGSKKVMRPESQPMEVSSGGDGTLCLCEGLGSHLSSMTNSADYVKALNDLPETSILYQNALAAEFPEFSLLVEEASSSLADWALSFLDRIYDLLRAAGEREKAGKTGSGVANRHSSSDVQQARNFSRVLKECLMQVFASMDEGTLKLAIRSVSQFLAGESLPSAAKDASALCQAVCSSRAVDSEGHHAAVSQGLDALIPILTDDLNIQSNNTLVYRIRCLAGGVKSAGTGVAKHRASIQSALSVALRSTDKHVYKTGCKLLRAVLSSLCEPYPLLSSYVPGISADNAAPLDASLGKSAHLSRDPVKWHLPEESELTFASNLLQHYCIEPIGESLTGKSAGERLLQLKRCLRVIRYSLRGSAGILIDSDSFEDTTDDRAGDDNNGSPRVSLVPHEQAVLMLLRKLPKSTRESISMIRKQLCSFIISLSSVIASETMDEESDMSKNGEEYGSRIGSDVKVCKEVSEICLLLLTRRGATFRCQETKSIWKAQKQLFGTDYALSAEADHFAASLQRTSLLDGIEDVHYKDGEDAGKSIPRRLLVARVQLFYESLQRNASFEVPRRLRRLKLESKPGKKILFRSDLDTDDALQTAMNSLGITTFRCLDGYEGLIDCLFALSCHPNTQVRAAGIGVIDYAMTRFGWLVKSRVPRLLAGVSLTDSNMHGKFGIPSCSYLSTKFDPQGKRKRLAEVLRGVFSILTVPRSIKEVMGSSKVRFSFIKTLCETDRVISLMPSEDMQKIVHYVHSVFSPYRSKSFGLPRSAETEQKIHESTLRYLLETLTEEDEVAQAATKPGDAVVETHWRKKLLVAWFLTNTIDAEDYLRNSEGLSEQIWKLCLKLLEKEVGQPLQRMALGLFGRLLCFAVPGRHDAELQTRLKEDSFCRVFGNALTYDHKEDTTVGGGHDAQWSQGVEDLLRDASRNLSPRSLFPFIRTGQSSSVFKIQHAQMVETLLTIRCRPSHEAVANFLSFASELADASPSEDQRNQQVTSSEIFAGVMRGLLLSSGSLDTGGMLESKLIPFLQEVIPKIPVSLAGAYFDAVRYGIHNLDSSLYASLTTMLVNQLESSLWQPDEANDSHAGENGDSLGSDGFTLQSKWLYLTSALLIELDTSLVMEAFGSSPLLVMPAETERGSSASGVSSSSWFQVKEELLPRLLNSLGHPYESCRDHIAGCLYRIYSYHCRLVAATNLGSAHPVDMQTDADPPSLIIKKFLSVSDGDLPPKEKYNSLLTIRRFMSYCTYLGDTKRDFEKIVLPLLPLSFEALKTNVSSDNEGGDDKAETTEDVAIRSLEADVVKGYRYSISELSITCILSYTTTRPAAVISQVLEVAKTKSKHELWQVRQAVAHFVRCFQGGHKFLLSEKDAQVVTTDIVVNLLADERREVSSAAMAAMVGILAASPAHVVSGLVEKYEGMARRSKVKKKKTAMLTEGEEKALEEKEKRRARNQQTSVYFLCAAIMANPYETPPYVPVAIAAVSKHSFERSAPLSVRDTVKKCCGAYKKTHMSDNWEAHRKIFSQEQLECLEDVVSSPHYYA